MSDLEKLIVEEGAVAPRITQAHIESVIVSETYTLLPSGKCLICELTLRNGYTVRGEASVVSKENFRQSIGEKISRENAVKQIWPLEGYLLQERLLQE